MKTSRFLFGAFALCAILFAAGQASAQSPTLFAGFGGFGGGFGLQRFSRVNTPRIPHFALYPPVYYSEPVARPYGFGPFAPLPGQIPAELRAFSPQLPVVRPAPTPEMIENPFVDEAEPLPPGEATEVSYEKQAARGAADLKLAPTQSLIENPYVSEPAVTRVAER